VIPFFGSRIVAQNKYIKRTMDLNRRSAPKKLRVSWNDPLNSTQHKPVIVSTMISQSASSL
jgi:hypothetical protein